MCGLCMSMLVPQEGFPCLTVCTTASGKPFPMLIRITKAMKRMRTRTKFLENFSLPLNKVLIVLASLGMWTD